MGLLGPPGAEFLHFVVGLGLILVAIAVLKRNPVFGGVLVAMITVGLAAKEFLIDPAFEGATIASGVTDVLWFYAGGAVGAFVGWVTNWLSALIALGIVAAVYLLLNSGVI